MAAVLFVLGLAAVVVAVGGLAGPWWALLAAGVVLVALAVLTERAPADPEPVDAEGGSR